MKSLLSGNHSLVTQSTPALLPHASALVNVLKDRCVSCLLSGCRGDQQLTKHGKPFLAGTASATIAYANSYDRDQLTHPATEAEYSENSLSYPNAYATTQPYEWKVIADANASVVTIDWNALEADDGFHKDVASYATPVANGVTTVTLGVFVPETGQAYQFDRTITVSDGSVVVSSEDGVVGAALTPAISDAIEDAIA